MPLKSEPNATGACIVWVPIEEEDVARDERILARLGELERLVERLVRHVIDVDEHALVHEHLDERLAERLQPVGVAARGGLAVRVAKRRAGERRDLRPQREAEAREERHREVEAQAVAKPVAVIELPEAALHDRLPEVDDALPGRGAAEGVVEVVDREDVADAHLEVLVDGRLHVLRVAGTDLFASKEVVDLDAEDDRELPCLDRLARRRRREDDAEPAFTFAAVLRVDPRLEVAGRLQLLVDREHRLLAVGALLAA